METKLNGLTLHVEPDNNPPHPRHDCDHLGTMLGWHRRYTLGDKNEYKSPSDFWASDEAKHIYVSLPVYLLDHSGLFLSTNDFHDTWDSGRLGLIYCTEEQAKKWFGHLSDEETVKQHLTSEIDTYNDYLNGSWYEFYIEGANGETLDSCGGFYQNKGFSELLDYMKEYADKEHHPLFDKLSAQLDKRACM